MTKEKNLSINYISEDILESICHSLAGELFRDEEPMGLYRDHDQAKLESSLNLPKQSVYGEELYPDLFSKAAILFYVINRNHIFSNGNKRLSVAVLLVFLYINDYIITTTQAEIRDKALEIAKTTLPIKEVTEQLIVWIKERSSIAVDK